MAAHRAELYLSAQERFCYKTDIDDSTGALKTGSFGFSVAMREVSEE